MTLSGSSGRQDCELETVTVFERSGTVSRWGSRRRHRRHASRFLPGAVLAGRYRIARLLGQGGMGEVYRADDLLLGERVALKFLCDRLKSDPAVRARFSEEVRLARQISHPNVCRVHDVGEVDGHLFLTMEHVDGRDLASLLRRGPRPSLDEARAIARQLCDALAAAHRQGILHRDLKPSNVMLAEDGRVLLTDFGLGLRAEDAARTPATPRGWGTPSYMAPELHEGYDASERSDLYALGLILYELFAGRRAFPMTHAATTPRWRRPAAVAPPSRWKSDLDPATDDVVLACLAPDPCGRPTSIREVMARLAMNGHGPAPTLSTLMASELTVNGRPLDARGLDAAEPASPDDDEVGRALRRHDRLARALLRRHGGREVRARAAFFAVFRDPASAAEWAHDYHRALLELSRESGVRITARVGVHLGEALLWEEPTPEGARWRAEGPGRGAAARLCARAEPGQTLLSPRAQALASRWAIDARIV